MRADATRHEGEFRRIVEGFNHRLDAVLAPVEEARRTLEVLARRDVTARVTGEYRGDHAKLKDALNATAEALQDALGRVADAAGQLSGAATRIASSSQQVAASASEQASALEGDDEQPRFDASMTQEAAAHAQQANSLAATTGSPLARGRGFLGRAATWKRA
jgi:methyl-accepting chemotaxis protein